MLILSEADRAVAKRMADALISRASLADGCTELDLIQLGFTTQDVLHVGNEAKRLAKRATRTRKVR